MAKKKQRSLKKQEPGPKPETLKIEGDWQDAMGKAMQKNRPAQGWPKDQPKK